MICMHIISIIFRYKIAAMELPNCKITNFTKIPVKFIRIFSLGDHTYPGRLTNINIEDESYIHKYVASVYFIQVTILNLI